MHIRIILKFLENYKCSGMAFSPSARYVSKEQSCLKTTGLMMIFYLVCSLSLLHILCSRFIQFMFSNFSISLFLFLMFFLKPLPNVVETLFIHTHTHTHSTHTYCCCSVSQSCPNLCDPMDCSTPGYSVLHHLLELAQTHIH